MGKERWDAAVDSVGGSTLVNVLAQTRYGGAVAACGLVEAPTMPNATVLPHILRGVGLLGVDSVNAPHAKRESAWQRLARDLPPATLDSLSVVEPLVGRATTGCRDPRRQGARPRRDRRIGLIR